MISDFPIFLLGIAASVSPSQLATIFNAGKSRLAFRFVFTIGDDELMEMMTNRLVIPNVKDLPRLRLARSVRQHDP